jgi:hypothetical protein
LQQLTKTPQTGSAQVLARFGVRLVILTAFAAFSSIGFGQSLVALLWMSTLLSAVIGGVRREPPLAPQLNHWDETAAYGALCALINALNAYL